MLVEPEQWLVRMAEGVSWQHRISHQQRADACGFRMPGEFVEGHVTVRRIDALGVEECWAPPGRDVVGHDDMIAPT